MTSNMARPLYRYSIPRSSIRLRRLRFAPPAKECPARSYVSPNLTLFLSLTNLRGVPYSLNGAAPGSIEETTLFFGDRIRFETLRRNKASPSAASAYPLDFSKPGAAGGWDVLQTAAMA